MTKQKTGTKAPEVTQTDKAQDAINNLNITAAMGGESTSTSVKGKLVSLNFKRETFLGIGPLWFSPVQHCHKVPDDLAPAHEERIRRALAEGLLIEGDVKVSHIDRNESVLEEYWQLIKSYGLETTNDKSKSMIAFRKLIRLGVDRNWTAKEVALYCIKQEKAYKNRERILKLLNDMYKFSLCPETLAEA